MKLLHVIVLVCFLALVFSSEPRIPCQQAGDCKMTGQKCAYRSHQGPSQWSLCTPTSPEECYCKYGCTLRDKYLVVGTYFEVSICNFCTCQNFKDNQITCLGNNCRTANRR